MFLRWNVIKIRLFSLRYFSHKNTHSRSPKPLRAHNLLFREMLSNSFEWNILSNSSTEDDMWIFMRFRNKQLPTAFITHSSQRVGRKHLHIRWYFILVIFDHLISVCLPISVRHMQIAWIAVYYNMVFIGLWWCCYQMVGMSLHYAITSHNFSSLRSDTIPMFVVNNNI